MTNGSAEIVTPDMKASFEANGFLVLPNFFDLKDTIEPIQLGAYNIIGQVLARAGLTDDRRPFKPSSFDEKYQELIARDRGLGGLIYDAVKQIPAFMRLCADRRLEQIFKELRPNSAPGLAAGGYGIRIDNPNEEKFRAPWHQEYPGQLRSLNGLVYWSPLVEITPDLGPVKIAVASHKIGAVPVYTKDPKNPDKSGAYSLILRDEENLVSQFSQVSPLTKPGDLVIMDFLVLHASGQNVGQRSRWSMQLRYFDFNEPTGVRHGWKGSFATGVDFGKVHPELVLELPT
jgi:hypothetical protein